MTRELTVVDGDILPGLRDALSGGPAILPSPFRLTGVPARVPQRVAVVIQTSGSTGRPKRVALSADALLSSAAGSESALGGPGQWLLALPTHYIAGVNVLVRSLAAGTEPVRLSSERFDAEAFVAAARRLDAPMRFTALVPAQLARLVAAAERDESLLAPLQRFQRILVGGQGTPGALLERCARIGLRLTRSYGSTETSGGCVYDGRPIGNTRVRAPAGMIEIGGSVLAEGYLGDDALTAERFEDGWYRTGDTGRLEGGMLTVTGRADDVIISGGVKVSLGELERLVRELPGLSEAVVIGRDDEHWGEVPVVVADHPVDLDVLRREAGRLLGAAARPAAAVVIERIPTLPSGKPDRAALKARLGGP